MSGYPIAMALAAAIVIHGVPPARAANPASPSDQYLALRRSDPPLTGVSPAQLESDPARYAGRTVEVQGRLSGTVRNDQGTILMLQSAVYGPLNLAMSSAPTWLESGENLRILAIIPKDTADASSVTIGMPDLVVVAVASENDIAALEAQARADADRRAAKEALDQAAMRAASTALRNQGAARRSSRAALAARGTSYTSNTASGGRLSKYLSPTAQRIYPIYVNFVQRWNPRLTTTDADAIASSILIYSEHYGVDPRLVVSLIIAESDFHPSETSNKGAMGLGQLMPDEVHQLGLTNPYDPIQNIAGAVYLLRGRLDHYATGQGLSMQQIILALASYNAGMGAVKRYGGVPPYRETQNYVRKIERIYTQLCSGDANG